MRNSSRFFPSNEERLSFLSGGERQQLGALLSQIKVIPYLRPDGKPQKEWKIFYGDSWTQAFDDARESALMKAKRDEQATGTFTFDLAYNKAREAIKSAAFPINGSQGWLGAWHAAYDAAKEHSALAVPPRELAAREHDLFIPSYAAADAGLASSLITIPFLARPFLSKHIKNVEARMEVWEKGYGLVGDVDGTLYVYSISPKVFQDIARLEIVTKDGSKLELHNVRQLKILELERE